MLNFIKKTMPIIILALLLFTYIFICANSYTVAVFSNIENSVFRLHVIANSDSEEDQNLKYCVRDALLNYMKEISKDCTTKEEAIAVAKQNADTFKQIALKTIADKGFNYDVNISIGNFDFPQKIYGDITLPAGCYDALRVEIGKATGQNWWCVMFPPLCFVDISSGVVPEDGKDLLKNNLSDEEYLLISENSGQMHFKFKIVELFQNNKMLTAEK